MYMGKYEPLTHYLESLDSESWDARFTEVERVLGFELPRSAHLYPAWWANQEGGHSQTRGWRDAGWETQKVDLPAKRVRFVRARRRRPEAATRDQQKPLNQDHGIEELFSCAREISGISDRNALIEAALKNFIQRETARYLSELGGTMPDAEAAPRRRFD
jgi:hypothetical protein